MKGKRFERHLWQPRAICSAHEADDFLKTHGIYDKVIKAVHVIGRIDETWRLRKQLCAALENVGISWKEWDTYPGRDKILVPWLLSVSEPLVIEFEDGSTLEMDVSAYDELLLAVDQITPGVVDGFNRGSPQAGRAFDVLKGQRIESVQSWQQALRAEYGGGGTDDRERRRYYFDLTGNTGFGIACTQGNHEVMLTYLRSHSDLAYETLKIAYGELKQWIEPARQLPIKDGYTDGGDFDIAPARHKEGQERSWDNVQRKRELLVGIEDLLLSSLLYPFLEYYLDKELQAPFRCSRKEGFDWYGENVYTYDTMGRMIGDIRKAADRLEADYDDPRLYDLKKGFRARDLVEELPAGIPEEEVVRANADLITDFYRRLCHRLEVMMAAAPEYEFITFRGP